MGIGGHAFGATPFGSQIEASLAEFSVGNWQPNLGFNVERLDYIAFDVLDRDDEYQALLVTDLRVRAIQGVFVEDIWTVASGFTALYYRGSTRLRIVNGNHYIVRRTGGWMNAIVVVDVTAKDLAGQLLRRQSTLL